MTPTTMCHGRTFTETAFPHAVGWLAKWRQTTMKEMFQMIFFFFFFYFIWLVGKRRFFLKMDDRTHTAHSYWLQYRETPAFLHFYHSLVRLIYSQQSVDNLQSSALISTISSNTQFYKLKSLQSVTYNLLKHSPLAKELDTEISISKY